MRVSGSRRLRPRHTSAGFVWLLVLMLAAGTVAQSLPDAAAEALRRGQQAASEATVTYERHSPDHPLWREALAAGREAAAAAPDHPAPRRFLAQAYHQVGWYARSWDAWQRYLDLGGAVDAAVERGLLDTAEWLGVQAHDAGRPGAARTYLEAVLELDPDHVGANERLARFHLDRGETEAALPYLEALDGRVPSLQAQWERAQLAERFGQEAADAYVAGREAREAGSLQEALQQFDRAFELRPTFVDAARQAGEVALQAGDTAAATRRWERVVAAAPDDAAAHAQLGRIAFGREDFEAAAERFGRAVAAAPGRDEYRTALAQSEQLAAEAAAAEAERVAAEEAARQAEEERARAAAEAAAAEARTEAERQAREEAERQAQEEAEERARVEAGRQAEEEAERAAREAEAEEARAAEARVEEETADGEAADRDAGALAEGPSVDAAPAEEGPVEEDEADAAAVSPEPLLLFDAVTEHFAAAGGPSGAVAFLEAPRLATDLSDHVAGVLHLRVRVTAKPSDEPVQYQFCMVPPDIDVSPACTDPDHLTLTVPGVYEADQPWSSLSGAGNIDWQAGLDGVMLVMRRGDGSAIDPSAGEGGPSRDAYLPMTTHVQAMAVPSGGPFPGWP